jgi:endonuclease G
MMGAWLTIPRIEVFAQGGNPRESVQLVEPLGWADADGREWWVPAGFRYNGASVPRPFWSIVGHPLGGRVLRASGLHDWHCRMHDDDSGGAHRRFYEGLRADGVARWRADLMYAAVRNFGPQFRRATL